MTVLEARRCTPFEFDILLEAKQLREVDRMYEIHMQAWTSHIVQGTRKNGKPVYNRFDKFFDYDKAMDRVRTGVVSEKKQKENDMAEQNRRLSRFRKMKREQEKRREEERSNGEHDGGSNHQGERK